MSATDSRKQARPTIDLLEEATVLLRAAPASALVGYYVGAVPFWLALLYFVADMSQSAFAEERLVGGSLGVALLFLWMKCWHVLFASQLRSLLFAAPEQAWTLRRALRMAAQQASIQPWSLILRPLALAVSSPFLLIAVFIRSVSVPFISVTALFQNAVVLGDEPKGTEGRSLLSRAWQQAQLWTGQAYGAVSILLIFGVLVWVNILSFFFAAPWLLKIFFDLETEASRNAGVIFNSTGLAASLALTLLFVDPILKAVYVLRCFYGESLHTGQDLRAQLQRVQKIVAAGIIGAVMMFSHVSSGFAAPVPPPSAAVDSTQLNRSIEEVLQQREYAWRTSRREMPEAGQQSGWAASVWKWIVEKVQNARETIRDWLNKRRNLEAGGGGWSGFPAQGLVYLLIAALVVIGVWVLWSHLKQQPAKTIEAQPLPSLPDLESEDVAADQLPEDGWLDLMRKSLAEGQRRLALRAAYLASLAHLGHRELLTIARHKSNREYSRELQRRARSREALLAAFGENMEVFERAWYGNHEVSDNALEQFTRNLETIRAC